MNIRVLVLKFCDYSVCFRGYSKATINRYKAVARIYSNQANIEDMEEISSDNLRNFFFMGRTKKNWGANTFVQYHKTLGVFFRWCIKEKYIENNPLIDIEIPKIPKKMPSKLTREQALRILEVAYNYPYKYTFLRSRNYAIFATFLFSGIRKKELLNLLFSDVDLENMSIFIRQGKGNKDRMVPISYKLADML